jgi:hypothetical protein
MYMCTEDYQKYPPVCSSGRSGSQPEELKSLLDVLLEGLSQAGHLHGDIQQVANLHNILLIVHGGI